jgi:hypothetical protein
MYKPEFVALQVTVLVRSDASRSLDIQEFMDSVEFKADVQEKLAGLIQENLQTNNVPFDEIIITLDRPPERAKPVESTQPSSREPSRLARLFGKK